MQPAILDRVSAAVSDLSKSERLVAKAVLDDPVLSSRENIADLARRAGVSQPTVFRFCRRFGCNGFPDFKQTLAASVDLGEGMRRAPGIRTGDSVGDIVRKVVLSASGALKDLQRDLDETVLARCVDVVSQARRVVICAQGASRPEGQDFRYQLLSLGMACEFHSDPQSVLSAAASLRQEDLLLVISLYGTDRDCLSAVDLALTNGAFTICVCPKNSPLATKSVLMLACGSSNATDDDLLPNAIRAKASLKILSGGVSLRRAELVRQVSPKIRNALKALGQPTDDSQSLQKDSAPDDNGALKPGEPITSLGWKL